MLNIQVRHFRAIERADIACSPIALVGALNGAGKTSIFQAVQAALTATPITMEGMNKKNAGKLVKRGAEEANVTVEGPQGAIRISWPKCATSETGKPPRCTAFAAGFDHLLDLDDRDRTLALGKYVDAVPTEEEIGQALFDLGYSVKAQRVVIDEVTKNGWDATWETAKQNGTKLKGKWEGITGEKWGSQKGADWKPEDWLERLGELDPDTAAQIVAEKQREVDKHIGNVAVATADLDRLRTKAACDIPNLDALREDKVRIETRIKDETAALAKLPATVSAEPVEMPCPSCGTLLVSDVDGNRKPVLKEAQKIDIEGLKAARLERAGIEGRIAKLRAELSSAERKLADANSLAAGISDAKAKLAQVEQAATKADADALALARSHLAEAQENANMVKALADARATYSAWVKNEKLTAVLAPDGLRKAKLIKGLATFNAKLAELSGWARWSPVNLTEDLTARLGDEPALFCSRAQNYLIRVTIQVAMAMIDGSAAVLIDDADTLLQRGRNGLFAMLQQAGIPALVCCAMNGPDKMPDLAKAGYGASYWVEQGITRRLDAPVAQAAQ